MNTCDCESYDCKGECCGEGNCTCTPEVWERLTDQFEKWDLHDEPR